VDGRVQVAVEAQALAAAGMKRLIQCRDQAVALQDYLRSAGSVPS
jgi:hypothetical protein